MFQGTNSKAVPIYRNNEVAEEINQKSGLEIEKLKAHKDKLEILKELQPKKQRRMKSKDAKAPKKRKTAGKRKLMTQGNKAKKAKIEGQAKEVKAE